jgi:very-short-patch-repair endonuclease
MGTSEGMKKVWATPDHRARRLDHRRAINAKRRRDKQELFLAVFSQTGVIKRAIEASGSSYSGYHHWMADDPEFAARFGALQSVRSADPRFMRPSGPQPRVPRDTVSRQQAQDAFLTAFAQTGLIKLACDESGVLASQHRTWLVRDSEYATRFAELRDNTRTLSSAYWVTRPRMKEKQRVFLDAVKNGASPAAACDVAGTGRTLYRYWMSVDPEFADDLAQIWTGTWRNRPTTIEIAVAAELTKRGITFEGPRTRIDGYGYDVDIYIPHLKLDVEADGDYWHSEVNFPGVTAHAIRRDDFLQSLGYDVLRLSETEINAGNWQHLDEKLG